MINDPQSSAPNNEEPPPFKFMTRVLESDYAHSNETVYSTIVSLRCLDLNLSGDAPRKRIEKILPPPVLFGSDVQWYPYVNVELWDLLQHHGCNLPQHHSKNYNDRDARVLQWKRRPSINKWICKQYHKSVNSYRLNTLNPWRAIRSDQRRSCKVGITLAHRAKHGNAIQRPGFVAIWPTRRVLGGILRLL